ncbi:unnamed protein product [Prunus armeniaca]
MKDNMLVRRSCFDPHLIRIKYPQTLEMLCKIHDGECGNHVGGRSLARRLSAQTTSRLPTPRLHGAIYLVGPMPPALANEDMMIVAIDYFTE